MHLPSLAAKRTCHNLQSRLQDVLENVRAGVVDGSTFCNGDRTKLYCYRRAAPPRIQLCCVVVLYRAVLLSFRRPQDNRRVVSRRSAPRLEALESRRRNER